MYPTVYLQRVSQKNPPWDIDNVVLDNRTWHTGMKSHFSLSIYKANMLGFRYKDFDFLMLHKKTQIQSETASYETVNFEFYSYVIKSNLLTYYYPMRKKSKIGLCGPPTYIFLHLFWKMFFFCKSITGGSRGGGPSGHFGSVLVFQSLLYSLM